MPEIAPGQWFDELAAIENPQPDSLVVFVDQIQVFLRFVLENEGDFAFLWEDDPNLLRFARETFDRDVSEGAGMLKRSIPEISRDQLARRGLISRPLRFKYRVMAAIARGWGRVRGQLTIRGWLKQVFDAIDAALDSLIAASGGVGGILKEFKDALSALAKTT
jgi:hypothetical protein